MKRTKVLIVEDEAIAALNIKMELGLAGYETCEFVVTGEAAIEKVEQEKPDVVLMDIFLKGKIDGIEAARKIRYNHDIPIIFMTGYDDNGTKERASEVEYVEYLIKPVEWECLNSAINKATQKKNE